MVEDNVASIMETSGMRLCIFPTWAVRPLTVDLGWSNICFLVWSFKMRPVDTKIKGKICYYLWLCYQEQWQKCHWQSFDLTISGVSTWLHLQLLNLSWFLLYSNTDSLASPPIPSSSQYPSGKLILCWSGSYSVAVKKVTY